MIKSIKMVQTSILLFLLYLQIDFIRSLEYTIVSKCNCKVIYGEIMTEYLSIKQTSEKWGITLEEYRSSVQRDVYLVLQRLAHIGLFLQIRRNQRIKGLRVVNISRRMGDINAGKNTRNFIRSDSLLDK